MTNIDYPKRASYETIQDYVKRLLDWLYDNKKLSGDEIKRLQRLDYSKRVFGINYPLIACNRQDIYDASGHARYWINYRLGGRYYVCSQWWLQNDKEYEHNLRTWCVGILNSLPSVGSENPRQMPSTNKQHNATLKEGDKVVHNKFGEGMVTSVSDCIEVNFLQVGYKKFPYSVVEDGFLKKM